MTRERAKELFDFQLNTTGPCTPTNYTPTHKKGNSIPRGKQTRIHVVLRDLLSNTRPPLHGKSIRGPTSRPVQPAAVMPSQQGGVSGS